MVDGFSGNSDPIRSNNARESQHSSHRWESFNNSGPWQGGNNPGKSSSSHNSGESANHGSYERVKKTMRWWINGQKSLPASKRNTLRGSCALPSFL